MANRGDVDDMGLATARDVCGFFDVAVPDGHFGRAEARPAAPTVVVTGGGRSLELAAEVWDVLWAASYGEADVRLQDGRFSGIALGTLAATANKLGFADIGGRLAKFRAGLGGLPFVMRGDGTSWKPAVLATLPVVRPEDYDGGAVKAAVQDEVLAYFGHGEETN